MRLGGRQVTGEMLFLSIQVCGVLFAFREEILTIHFFVKQSSFFVNLSNNLLLIGFLLHSSMLFRTYIFT